MLTKIKKRVMEMVHDYHLKMSDYYYGKMDEHGSENNEYYGGKVTKHTRKCLELNLKLKELEES